MKLERGMNQYMYGLSYCLIGARLKEISKVIDSKVEKNLIAAKEIVEYENLVKVSIRLFVLRRKGGSYMVAEKQKMKEELNSVLTVEFMELEEIAKEYHQRKHEFRNAYPADIADASACLDVAENRLGYKESYLSGILHLARRLDLITAQSYGKLLEEMAKFRKEEIGDKCD
jgi:hypothetical protein